jgi:putative pyruvate formate lyase activating enzyme
MEFYLSVLERCELCPRKCGANRRQGEFGYCGVGAHALVAHHGAHFGEEPPISGTRGSGNIFFASCNLRCIYCQNYQISHMKAGKEVALGDLVDMFFRLEQQGCHNINLVSPTPYVPVLAAAITEAKTRGIAVPFVYNTNAYENVQTLKVLDGLIDIYLPDFKYWSGEIARRLSNGPDYPEAARKAIKEMKRQVGNLVAEGGIAKRGLLLRHLVLPGGLAGSRQIITWIGDHLGRETCVSLMSQYYPLFGAAAYPILNRKVNHEEYDRLVELMTEQGFQNVFVQELGSAPLLVPDFNKAEPFLIRG